MIIDVKKYLGKKMKCYDLVRLIYQDNGKYLPELGSDEIVSKYFFPVKNPHVGDVCRFELKDDELHVAVYVKGKSFLTTSKNGVILARFDYLGHASGKFVGYYRYND